jgi:hypothetical protein
MYEIIELYDEVYESVKQKAKEKHFANVRRGEVNMIELTDHVCAVLTFSFSDCEEAREAALQAVLSAIGLGD